MGSYIVFEGIDGSGKSVVSKHIAEEMDAIHTREPTSRLAEVIMANDHPHGDALLFAADRAMHMEDIREWLENDKTIISDRSVYSNMAYQGAALKEDMCGFDNAFKWVEECNKPFLIEADKVLLLDLPVNVSLERVDKRGPQTRFEMKDYLEEVRKAYLVLSERYGFTMIDASQSLEKVISDCKKALDL